MQLQRFSAAWNKLNIIYATEKIYSNYNNAMYSYQCCDNYIFFPAVKHRIRIFITLQYFGNNLGIFLKQKFVESSSIILERLLCDYWNLPKDEHLWSSHIHMLWSNHILLLLKQLS